MREKAIYMC